MRHSEPLRKPRRLTSTDAAAVDIQDGAVVDFLEPCPRPTMGSAEVGKPPMPEEPLAAAGAAPAPSIPSALLGRAPESVQSQKSESLPPVRRGVQGPPSAAQVEGSKSRASEVVVTSTLSPWLTYMPLGIGIPLRSHGRTVFLCDS